MTTLNIWTGAELNPNIDFSLLDPDGVTEHSALAALMPGGAYSVDNLLGIEGFGIGHRGCSIDCAEMSLRAYTEAVVREVHALEFSASRSSDGIWFGLHDETLLRTSGIDLDPKLHTWRQIQQYRAAAPVGGNIAFGARPYLRLTKFLQTYAKSHVIFFDPKYHAGAQWRSEMFDVLESNVRDAHQHVVVKYSGGGTSLADDSAAAGFTTVGYFYQEEYLADPAQVLENAEHWTWIELEHGAPQSTWDAFAALGKPMIGFTASTLAQYDTAMAKGAWGVMCSGVRNIFGAPVI